MLTGATRSRAELDRAQGSMLRIAALLAMVGGTLAAGPVAAQSGFGDAPPRPPVDVPNGAFPPQPPPVGFPGPAGRSPSGIQSQPLPPPGAMNTPPAGPGQAPQGPPVQRARVAPQPGNPPPPPQPANPPPPQPADTAPRPDDTIVTEMPAQKIVNGRAVFSGLDKITGRIINFDAAIGETVQFGALQVTARVCYTRPPTEATNTDAFLEVDEVTLRGEVKRVFTGWMFASSPGLHAIEHPIYDIWLTDCAQPAQSQAAQPVAPAAPAPAAATGPHPAGQPPRVRQATPRQQQRTAPPGTANAPVGSAPPPVASGPPPFVPGPPGAPAEPR
jgi:hypothetical protein